MKFKREQEPVTEKPSMTTAERDEQRRRKAISKHIRAVAKKELAWFPPSHESAWLPWQGE